MLAMQTERQVAMCCCVRLIAQAAERWKISPIGGRAILEVEISAQFDESDLGGFSLRLKLSVGY